MSWLWNSLAVSKIFFVLQALSWKTNTKTNKKLPTEPKGFPIFGCLHLLGQFPHRVLHRLAKKYGPIMHSRLGLMSIIVVSSPQAAELFLKTRDLIFASRAPLQPAKHISYEQNGLALSQYGSYWRTLQKIGTLELLSNFKINYFQAMRKEELDLSIASIKEAERARCVVDVSANVSTMSAEMTCRIVFGKKYSDDVFDGRGFKTMIEEGEKLTVKPNLGNYIPQIAGFDLQGRTKRMKAVSRVFDGFLEKIIDEHVQSKDKNITKDFVDVMLSFEGSEETEHKIERELIKDKIYTYCCFSVNRSQASATKSLLSSSAFSLFT